MKKYIFLIVSLIIFTACFHKEKKDIKIGFVAGLTGKYSPLGIDVRNGFLLAFDEINYKIKNTKIQIVQKDDKQDPKVAKSIIDEFVKNKINLIVGNTTSTMTEVSLSTVNNMQNTLLISATASSSSFSNKDDNFLRIQVEHSKKRYKKLVDYLIKNNAKNIFFIYDSKNATYVNEYETHFQDLLIERGGNPFVSKMDINDNYKNILEKIKYTNSDMILIVASSIDTAKMVQYLRINKIDKKILSSGWVNTPDFIVNGGKYVDGVVLNTSFNIGSKSEQFLKFAKKYEEEYKRKPSVFAAQAYELGKILIEELNKKQNTDNMKNRILETKKYQGLQGNILFDKYGDISREYLLMEVKNGEFRKIED